jgi:hypothetical protein
MSFASLILLARYGAPPRSGWLASIICLWASLIFVFRTAPSLKRARSIKIRHSYEIERETHLRPRMARASFLSILALKPPLAHSWAAPRPPRTPLLIRVRPAMAAAIAPTPRMIGVDIWEKHGRMRCRERRKLRCCVTCGRSAIADLFLSSEPLRSLDPSSAQKMALQQPGSSRKASHVEGTTEFEILKSSHQ